MNGNMTPSLILNVLEPKIFQYYFLEGNSEKMAVTYHQHTEM